MPTDDDDFDVSIEADDEDETDSSPQNDKEDKESGDDAPGERARRAAKAARKERDDARRELAEMRKQVAELKAGGAGTKPDPKAAAELDREADERAHARYRPVLIRAEATAALVRAGAKPDRVTRLSRLLDADEINVDEKGNVDADDLTEQVDKVKEEWPELFRTDDDSDGKPARRPGGSRRVDGAGRKGTPGAPSSTAKLAAALTRSK